MASRSPGLEDVIDESLRFFHGVSYRCILIVIEQVDIDIQHLAITSFTPASAIKMTLFAQFHSRFVHWPFPDTPNGFFYLAKFFLGGVASGCARWFGEPANAVVLSAGAIAVAWLLLYHLYRQKLFLRV